MKCLVCHQENRDGSRYWVYCGSPLKEKRKDTHDWSMASILIIASLIMLAIGYILHPEADEMSIAGTYQSGTTVLSIAKDGAVTFNENDAVYYGMTDTDGNAYAGTEILLKSESGEEKDITVYISSESAEVFERTGNYNAVRTILKRDG